jgi:hypothetical protein
MVLHSYQVPKLEYTGEDIKLGFDLTVKRGEHELILAATMCTTKLETCT